MAKKRKAGGRPFGQDSPEKTYKNESKLKINTFKDVADSEDEFHMGRDKILLEEGPVQKRQRKLREDEQFLEFSDEEVLAESSDVPDVDGEDEDEEDYEDNVKIKGKPQRSSKGLQDSDTEASARHEEDEDMGDWGSSKRDYYNADTIETEADALEEEAEARMLQKKQLEGFTEADFGFDESEWQNVRGEEGEDEGNGGDVVQEVLPRLEVTDSMSPKERLKILRLRYPEFEPLAKEFLELEAIHEDLRLAANTEVSVQSLQHNSSNVGSGKDEVFTAPAVIRHSVLSAYLAALCMYFALFTSGHSTADGKATAMDSVELRDHSVMDTLVQCRELWGKVKDIASPEPVGLQIATEKTSAPQAVEQTNRHFTLDTKIEGEAPVKIKKKRVRKSKAQRAAEITQAEAEARRAERLRKTEEDLAGLSPLTAPRKLSSKLDSTNGNNSQLLSDDSDIGEQNALTAQEAAEKAKRKKSLRFYTSQIAQKSNKRDAAGRDAGGDADLPYRERFRDRQLRLNVEAEARGKKSKEHGKGNDDLGGPSDDEDHTAAKGLRDDVDSDDYYNIVSSRMAAKKSSKVALAAAHAQAEREGGILRVVEEEGVGGKRAITYAIEKNKGLAPRRKKDVRNPRVKKRKKFEEKQKKLGSVRAVYKGGEGKGGYGGELTGIKTGLVKSVKLS